jgi:hypothetical protein
VVLRRAAQDAADAQEDLQEQHCERCRSTNGFTCSPNDPHAMCRDPAA